jgi:8-oxo-dGTP pyrophosphatase MutT (NUDIX family)
MIEPWTVLSSRIALSDRWIRVRADTCRRRDGLAIDPYYVFEFADWVCIVALTNDGEVVLTKEYRHGIATIMTGLPGGVVDHADASVQDAAARELAEETGYVCERLTRIGSLYSDAARQTNSVHYFLGSGAQLTRAPSLDANEQIEVVRLPWDRVRSSDILRQGHHVAAIHLAERHLASQ